MTTAEYLERKSRRSDATRLTYTKAGDAFAKCFNVDSPDVVVARIKGGNLDAYKALDKFVGFLLDRGNSPKTVWVYISGVKGLLRYEGINLDSYQLRAKIEMPPKAEVSTDRIPSKAEMREIIMNSDRKTRALVALLATSGLRVGEAASLRISNIDFSANKITLMAQKTKTRKSRITFITEETNRFIKEYIGPRSSNKDAWVFMDERDSELHSTADGLYMNIYRVLEKLNLKNRLDPDSRRNELHPHSFRKYFFSKLIGVGVDRGIAERLMGHSFGLDRAYLHMDESKVREEYDKALSDFVFLSDTKLEKQTQERVAAFEEENKELKDKVVKLEAATEEMRKMVATALQGLKKTS